MENSLKKFIIKKFVLVLLCVGIIESIISFLNSLVIFPLMNAIFNLDLSRKNLSLSGKEFIILCIFIILMFLLGLLSQAVPGILDKTIDWAMSGLQSALGKAIPQLQGEKILNEVSGNHSIFLAFFIIAIITVILLPYIIGAIYFAKVTVKEVSKLQQIRDEEKKEYDRRRNLMLSDIAHDLRTPMTTVTGYAKALSDGMITDETKKQEYLAIIQNKAARMDDLINLLFDYVKLDSDGFSLDKQKLDLCELLRENAALLYSDLEDNGYIFDIDIPEEKYFVEADRVQLSRVITNLLVNVMRHNEAGTKVLLRMIITERTAKIQVADSGVDIPKEQEQNIFEPFAKMDKSRTNSSGSGLGLSIVKKIVDKHGYSIQLTHDVKLYTKAFEIEIANLAN